MGSDIVPYRQREVRQAGSSAVAARIGHAAQLERQAMTLRAEVELARTRGQIEYADAATRIIQGLELAAQSIRRLAVIPEEDEHSMTIKSMTSYAIGEKIGGFIRG